LPASEIVPLTKSVSTKIELSFIAFATADGLVRLPATAGPPMISHVIRHEKQTRPADI
jgi:hypothetical protein